MFNVFNQQWSDHATIMTNFTIVMMKRCLLLFVYAIIPTLGNTQDVLVVDSLRLALSGEKDAFVRSQLFEELAWEFRKAYPDSTIHYAGKSINLIELNSLSRNKSQALTFIGVAYNYKGDYLKSFDFYTAARKEAQQHNDTLQIAHAVNSLGRLYFNQGSFLKAYDHFYEALEYFTAINEALGTSYVYKSLSELHRSQNNLEKAQEMAEKTLEIRQTIGDDVGQISAIVELAIIYVERELYDEALAQYRSALDLAESISDKIGVARVNLGISQLHSQRNNSDAAFNYAKKALTTVTGSKNEELLNKVKLQYAEVLIALKKYDEAKIELESLIMNTAVAKLLSLERDAHLRLAEIYELESNASLALMHFKRYQNLREAWSNAEAARNIERLEARLVLENKEKENELLRLNEARSIAVIERHRFGNIALIAVLTLIGMVLIGIWYASRKRNQMYVKLSLKNKHIEQQAHELETQSDKIQRQNEKLKRRNAQLADLNNEKDTLMNIVAHDLKSPINRVKGIAELLSFSHLTEDQNNYVKLLKEISTSGNELIRDLLDVNAFEDESRKLNISEVNIVDIVKAKQQAFLGEARAKNISFNLYFDNEEIRIKTDNSLLVRILDNLISNAIKFSARDTDIAISISDSTDGLKLIIKDQGPGFTEADKQQLYKKFRRLSARPTAGESSNGLGLAIVKSLCDRLGISIKLDSDADLGSRFTLKFPQHAKVENAVSVKP
ncbi:MAG: ATP-binding protein [Bacteroidota bacterium]